MAKQVVLIMILSVLTIVFKMQLGQALDSIVYLHNYLARALHIVFSDDAVGSLIQDMIALLLIPLIVGLVVSGVFWLIKRSHMPNIMSIIWVVWLVLLVTMVAQDGTTSNKMVHQSNSKMALHASYNR